MACGKASSYMDMTVGQKVTSHAVSADGKENFVPYSKSHRNNPTFTEPFPELSASSEDEISLHSMEESISLHSAAGGSIDSMSMSSQSSCYGGSILNSLHVDLEPQQQVVTQKPRKPYKTPKVTSYIQEDCSPNGSSSQTSGSDYIHMSPVSK